MGRILGIDLGEKRIGLALSDPMKMFAAPLKVVEGESALKEELKKLLVESDIERIVVGLPLNMDGSVGPKARAAMLFKERLEKEHSMPVDLWDERLTTVQAHGALRESGLSAGKRAGRVDKIAAQILLQTYLDRQKASP